MVCRGWWDVVLWLVVGGGGEGEKEEGRGGGEGRRQEAGVRGEEGEGEGEGMEGGWGGWVGKRRMVGCWMREGRKRGRIRGWLGRERENTGGTGECGEKGGGG